MAIDNPLDPTRRRLRIYSHDPALAARLDFAGIAELTISVPWEKDLKRGPIGEYIEVVDIDPASGCVYAPVDLDHRNLMAIDGLAPSESNPQFHQQMTYAVAMATIRHFERALGRPALWSERTERKEKKIRDRFVRRLRIYPHALRDRNAFYSSDKKAILFGYFPVERAAGASAPGTMVFTCLSHDIIAHEVTHALLDGVHPRFAEAVNADVLAFHEAFADIVALFQHFSYPGILRDQIARTRGNLAEESLLGQLAQQFGEASGRGGALRSYLGELDAKTGIWKPAKPDPSLIDTTLEPHDRGAILVAAVFGAFMKVYRVRTRDLYRIATEGTGVLREGDIHPDLVGRLADEASRCADYMLQMCIRAIDYCPPVGITFGDYLRGVVTADFDMEPEDRSGYRLAFMESFREWGINPPGILSLSIESLLWPTGDEAFSELAEVEVVAAAAPTGTVQASAVDSRGNPKMAAQYSTRHSTKQIRDTAQAYVEDNRARLRKSLADTRSESAGLEAAAGTDPSGVMLLDEITRLGLSDDRYRIWEVGEKQKKFIWRWLMDDGLHRMAPALGLVVSGSNAPATVFRSRTVPSMLAVEIHSVRTALRRDRQGRQTPDLVVEVTQRRRGYFDPAKQKRKDAAVKPLPPDEKGDFIYRAGCTLLLDPISMSIRRVIRSGGRIDNETELARMRDYLINGGIQPSNAFAGPLKVLNAREPFALLHGHGE